MQTQPPDSVCRAVVALCDVRPSVQSLHLPILLFALPSSQDFAVLLV